jgi:hypothetical protein
LSQACFTVYEIFLNNGRFCCFNRVSLFKGKNVGETRFEGFESIDFKFFFGGESKIIKFIVFKKS